VVLQEKGCLLVQSVSMRLLVHALCEKAAHADLQPKELHEQTLTMRASIMLENTTTT